MREASRQQNRARIMCCIMCSIFIYTYVHYLHVTVSIARCSFPFLVVRILSSSLEIIFFFFGTHFHNSPAPPDAVASRPEPRPKPSVVVSASTRPMASRPMRLFHRARARLASPEAVAESASCRAKEKVDPVLTACSAVPMMTPVSVSRPKKSSIGPMVLVHRESLASLEAVAWTSMAESMPMRLFHQESLASLETVAESAGCQAREKVAR